ncbi:MAG TPA: ABC transporter permease, partial [Pseudonocardiaceae bacterium]|nr:ABC transporter permease [Pseudonocardiaceae bacterium]
MTTNSVLSRPVLPPSATRRFGWPRDVVLGLRLAVGGGRTSLARLVLGTIGIGMATAVLLVSASVSHILANEHQRENNAEPNGARIAGVSAITFSDGQIDYRGSTIPGTYLRATGPNAALPPGVTRLPGPNEIVLSPALAQLLDSSDGALLRPRLPQHVIGLIGPAGLAGPQDLTFYAYLAPGMLPAAELPQLAYSFGPSGDVSSGTDPILQALILVGVVALMVPILIMVAVSS